MDPLSQNQSGAAMPNKQQIDFGAMHSTPQPSSTNQTTQPSTPQQSTPQTQPTPVTSAKAAINAMYAEQAKHPQPPIVMSAREAVNAAAGQAGAQQTKSAANLHHGSIQRSMESTRTSASALLRRAEDETKIDTRTSSLDPLAKSQPASAQKRPEREIPVVRTSLKLGAAARPKPAPVVLPPNARMARVARPVNTTAQPTSAPSKLAKFLRRNVIDAQIVQPQGVAQGTKTKTLASGQANSPAKDDTALTVKIIPSAASEASAATSAPSPQAKRKVSAVRDPQMLAGARRSASVRAGQQGAQVATKARTLSRKAQTAEVLGMANVRTSRFRTKPKDFSANQPSALPTDSSYVMAEPPKLNVKKKSTAPDDLGVIESYHPENPPQPIGDKAPTGSIKAQKVAAGHVSTTPELPTIKADNTSNYSFSKKKSEPDNNRYALGGESPFLRSVNVEKRPLSSSPGKFNPKVERSIAARAAETSRPAAKPGRKNRYEKKPAPAPHQELPVRPTVIVPSNRRSKAPLVFLILITIILGAAVGAAVYLCFFQ